VYLVGTMLLVVAIGLYELLVRPVGASQPGSRLPRWRMATGLKGMAARLVPMLVLIAVVSFAAVVAGVSGGRDVLLLGGGLTLVIAALMAFLGPAPAALGTPDVGSLAGIRAMAEDSPIRCQPRTSIRLHSRAHTGSFSLASVRANGPKAGRGRGRWCAVGGQAGRPGEGTGG
jgi:hypothetical protein